MHIRDGSALLLHAAPAYTIHDTRAGPYSLLVSQAADGYAFGTAYLDDGETFAHEGGALVWRAFSAATQEGKTVLRSADAAAARPAAASCA